MLPSDSPTRSRSALESRSTAAMSCEASPAVSRSGTSVSPVVALMTRAASEYPEPREVISPVMIALIPSRRATSVASA